MNNTYDLLFSDLEGTKLYQSFLKKHIQGHTVLEFACGTGDLLNLLNEDYEIIGVDLDQTMINSAITKYPHLKKQFQQGSYLDFQSDQPYDTVICVGDSLNYMENEDELDVFVNTTTQLSNHIIVDFHHPYRLVEFDEPYFEEGRIEGFDYAYQIEKDEDRLIHTINYLDGTFDQVQQWVFRPNDLINRFEAKGYLASVYTDFCSEGILEEGEKIMCIFSKV